MIDTFRIDSRIVAAASWPALALLAGLLGGCAGMLSWEGPGDSDPAYTSANLPPAAPRSPEPLPQRPVGPSDHLVRKGDTIYSIAFRNQLDYRELARWNNIGPDYRIYTGQVLRLTPPGELRATGSRLAVQTVDLNETGKPQPLPRGAGASPLPRPVPVPAAPAGSSPPPLSLPPASPAAVATAPGAATTAAAAPLPPPATATVPTVAGASGGLPGWRWPTEGGVLRGFNPDAGSRGLDFTGTVGQPVVAVADGKVVYSGSALKGYGELVIIKHDDLRLSAYGYNRRRLVKDGDTVVAGQPIAELGLGPENKPLLHFEIRERGRPVNPAGFLPAR